MEEILLEYNYNEIAYVNLFPISKGKGRYSRVIRLKSDREENRDRTCEYIYDNLEYLYHKMEYKSDDTYLINKKNLNLLKKLEKSLKELKLTIIYTVDDFKFVKDKDEISIYYRDKSNIYKYKNNKWEKLILRITLI